MERHKPYGIYEAIIKRVLDILISLFALIILSPLLLVLMILGSLFMGGNPFFFQSRPGKNGKVFKLIKFRTMDNRKDKNGELLPDEIRLNAYGRFLRASSLDELPELINILLGQMAIVGPRPLLVQYLDLYNEEQKHRHDVRPGLTGLAQINGRNAISWTEKFKYDIEYVNHITFFEDLKILIKTVIKVIKRDGVSADNCATADYFDGHN